jgi:hypothetical protein
VKVLPATARSSLVKKLLATPAARNYLAVAALVLLAALSMARHWGGPISWETDALFYQATSREIAGEDAATARREIFSGPLSGYERRIERENPGEPRRVSDPAWVEYSAPFYARRLLLPALAAALDPLLGLHALQILSLLGFILVPALLFALLRRRLSLKVSLSVALAVILWPPLRDWSVFPLSDSFGLALLIASLLCAALTIERDRRWLWPWLGCVLALGFTRDLAFMPVLAALCLLLVRRDRTSAALLGTGVLAALPPLLVHGLSQSESLTYIYANHAIPTDTSWAAAISGYPGNLGHMLGRYATYAGGHPAVVVLLLGGLVSAFLLAPRRDPLTILLWSTLLGYLLALAVGPAFSGFRYELLLVPLMAFGYGHLLTRGVARIREARAAPRARNDARPALSRR